MQPVETAPPHTHHRAGDTTPNLSAQPDRSTSSPDSTQRRRSSEQQRSRSRRPRSMPTAVAAGTRKQRCHRAHAPAVPSAARSEAEASSDTHADAAADAITDADSAADVRPGADMPPDAEKRSSSSTNGVAHSQARTQYRSTSMQQRSRRDAETRPLRSTCKSWHRRARASRAATEPTREQSPRQRQLPVWKQKHPAPTPTPTPHRRRRRSRRATGD